MAIEFFTALEEDEGARADKFLADNIEGFTRDKVAELFDRGVVLLNDSQIKRSRRVKAGDVYSVDIPKIVLPEILPEDIPIIVVYEDEHIAVVDKAAGMVVHPAPGNYSGTLVNALLYHLSGLSAINGVIRPGIVHRIDKDTSGLLVIAKNDMAHRALAEQFANHSITRAYKAYVHGNFDRQFGLIDAPLARSINDRKTFSVSARNGKSAITRYSVEKQYNGFSLLELRLQTGRTHQIRVHMKYIGHPVVGDKTYGRGSAVDKIFGGQLLHAYQLGFIHPATKDYMEFRSALPSSFAAMERILS